MKTNKITYLIFGILILVSCKNKLVLLDYKGDTIGIIQTNKESIENIEIEKLTQFYESGELKSKGQFKVGDYTQCCFAGPCIQNYIYKVGEWSYFHKNGELKAYGKYLKKKRLIQTSCKGGDSIFSGFVDQKWKFYDKNGNSIVNDKKLISEIEDGSVLINYTL